MVTPMFSLLHSSARPHKWREVYDAWIQAAVHPENVEYVLCVDARWGFADNLPTNKTGHEIFGLRPEFDKLVWNTGRRCYVDGVNTAALASTGQILIVSADDQFPCTGWDTRLLDELHLHASRRDKERNEFRSRRPKTWPEFLESDFVVQVSTGTPEELERRILVMPILSRFRYRVLGNVFYPGYESMFADNDFFEHAEQDRVILDSRTLMFPHRHPLFDSTVEWDEPYREQNRDKAYDIGARVLGWRRKVGFGREIERAAYITEGGTSVDELETLSFWASQMTSVVELGSWVGRSTRALSAAAAGLVTAVDTFQGSVDEPDMLAMVKARGGSVLDQFRDNVHDVENLVYHVGDSAAYASLFPFDQVDMVFIDGGHSYEQVKADLLAWLPKTRKLICGHDYAVDCPGVMRAVDEILGPPQRAAGRLWYRSLAGEVSTLYWSGDSPPLFSAAPESRVGLYPVSDGDVSLRKVRGSIALAFPGESFSGLWVSKLLEIMIHLLSSGWNYSTILNYTSNAGITRQTIAGQIEAMAKPQAFVSDESGKRYQLKSFVPDYIVWIDDDQIVEPGLIDLLISDLEALPDVDMIAGWTWIASNGAHFNPPQVSCGRMNLEKGEVSHAERRSVQSANGVFEVHWTGFPLVVMRPGAIQKAGKHPFAHYPCPESPWGECGEDISFCKRLRDAGGRIYVDSRAFVPHLKLKPLGPSPESMDEIALALSGKFSSHGFRVFEPAIDRGPRIENWEIGDREPFPVPEKGAKVVPVNGED